MKNLNRGTGVRFLRRWDTAQIVVQNLKTGERKVIVSSGSGAQIVFPSGGGLKFVDVQTNPSIAFSEPKPLPIAIENTQGRPCDITPDGKFFLVMQRPSDTTSSEKSAPQISIVLNWFRELQERVPVK